MSGPKSIIYDLEYQISTSCFIFSLTDYLCRKCNFLPDSKCTSFQKS